MDITPAGLSAFARGDMENFVVASTPGGIEAQEAAGQQALCSNFSRLPKEFGFNATFPTEILERLGFKIGESIDELFVAVTPPEGWRMEPTDHSMWSHMVDQKGRKRASVFYKAAFYDRKAHFRFEQRYIVDRIYTDAPVYEEGTVQSVVRDQETKEILFSGKIFSKGARDWDQEREDEKICSTWLDENFPENKNPEAYW